MQSVFERAGILMFGDRRRQDCGAIAVKSVTALAAERGWRCFIEDSWENYENPYARKLELIEAMLPSVSVLIYVDTDVLFRVPSRELSPLISAPVTVSKDANGICTGFMALQNTPRVIDLVGAWRRLGECDGAAGEHEQATLKLLGDRFSWVRKMIGILGEDLVSNPESACPGSIAHHFWHTDPKLIEHMARFDWSKPLPPKW